MHRKRACLIIRLFAFPRRGAAGVFPSAKKKYGQVRACDKQVAISFMIPLSIIEHVFDRPDDEKDYYAFSYQLNSSL